MSDLHCSEINAFMRLVDERKKFLDTGEVLSSASRSKATGRGRKMDRCQTMPAIDCGFGVAEEMTFSAYSQKMQDRSNCALF